VVRSLLALLVRKKKKVRLLTRVERQSQHAGASASAGRDAYAHGGGASAAAASAASLSTTTTKLSFSHSFVVRHFCEHTSACATHADASYYVGGGTESGRTSYIIIFFPPPTVRSPTISWRVIWHKNALCAFFFAGAKSANTDTLKKKKRILQARHETLGDETREFLDIFSFIDKDNDGHVSIFSPSVYLLF